MDHHQEQAMRADFARYALLHDKVAHANSDYEMAQLMQQADRVAQAWQGGTYANDWAILTHAR